MCIIAQSGERVPKDERLPETLISKESIPGTRVLRTVSIVPATRFTAPFSLVQRSNAVGISNLSWEEISDLEADQHPI